MTAEERFRQEVEEWKAKPRARPNRKGKKSKKTPGRYKPEAKDTRKERARRQRSAKRFANYSEYASYLRSPEWNTWRKNAFKRDDYKCVYCHAAAEFVHHVTYPKRIGCEEPRLLQSVCGRCHKLAHGGHPKLPEAIVFVPGVDGVAVLDDIINPSVPPDCDGDPCRGKTAWRRAMG